MRVLIALALLALAGCVSSGTRVDDKAAQQFQKGVTTEAEVVKAIGPPQSTALLPDGRHQIGYVALSAHPHAASFIPVVGLFAGGASSQSDVTTFTFGTDGKLAEIASQHVTADAHLGASAQ